MKVLNNNFSFLTAWKDFVDLKANVWEVTNLGWINEFPGPILIIFYNDLKVNVERNLRNILNFVNFPINEKLLECALRKKEGSYKRLKRPSFDPFTAEMKKMLDEKRVLVYDQLDNYMENQYL